MIFTVLWVFGAEQSLAAQWLLANDRQEITAAAYRIDQALRIDPATKGESREAGRRILFEYSLAVVYRVQPDDRIVHVLEAWRYHKRGR